MHFFLTEMIANKSLSYQVIQTCIHFYICNTCLDFCFELSIQNSDFFVLCAILCLQIQASLESWHLLYFQEFASCNFFNLLTFSDCQLREFAAFFPPNPSSVLKSYVRFPREGGKGNWSVWMKNSNGNLFLLSSKEVVWLPASFLQQSSNFAVFSLDCLSFWSSFSPKRSHFAEASDLEKKQSDYCSKL